MAGVSEIRRTWDLQPVRPAACDVVTTVLRPAEGTRGIELPGTDLRQAMGAVGLLDGGDRKECMVGVGTRHAPIETRMGIEDIQAAAEQEQQAQCVDPMCRAHQSAMPVETLATAGIAELVLEEADGAHSPRGQNCPSLDVPGDNGLRQSRTLHGHPPFSSETKIAQARVIVRTAPERPMIFAVGFGDWGIIDAGNAPAHQPVRIELPQLVAVGPEPMTAVAMPFIGKA